MAKLSKEKMTLEIKFTRYKFGWVNYEIKFLWDSAPIINDAVLKRNTDFWNSRSNGAFVANDDEKDRLIPFIKKVLKSDKTDYWQPVDPDVTIEIYPDDLDLYPPIESHFKVIKINGEMIKKMKEREALKRKSGQLDDDLFVIVTRIDAYNFKDQNAYCNFGTSHSCCLSLLLKVTRAEMRNFVEDLEKEYGDFCIQYGLAAEDVEKAEEVNKKVEKADKECFNYVNELNTQISKKHPSGYFVGQWVKHYHFGDGIVRDIGSDTITITFEGYGLKKLALNYANIKTLDQRRYRRMFFEQHPFHSRGYYTCPCCGYPTLNGLRSYETCFLCEWENALQPYGNEQDDHNSDIVLGGLNDNYSLTEARRNFEKHTTMFSPDDKTLYAQRYFKPEIIDIKRNIKLHFDLLVMSWDSEIITCIWKEIEKCLKDLKASWRSGGN